MPPERFSFQTVQAKDELYKHNFELYKRILDAVFKAGKIIPLESFLCFRLAYRISVRLIC